MLVKATGIGEGETLRAEGVSIDLAEIEADAVIGRVDGILELEDGFGDLAGRAADLDAATVVGEGDVRLGEGAAGADLLLGCASGRGAAVALAADVDVHGESACVVH